jgi:hypothetical protein
MENHAHSVYLGGHKSDGDQTIESIKSLYFRSWELEFIVIELFKFLLREVDSTS